MLRTTALLTLAGFAALVTAGACGGSTSNDFDDPNGDGGSATGGSSTSGSAGKSTGGSAGSGTSGKGGSATGGSSTGGSSTGGSSTGGSATGGSSTGGSATGGSAGTGPRGGDGGSAMGGTAGAKGGAGGGGGRECESDDDCEIFSDCCSCMGVPTGQGGPGCDLVCIQDRCSSLQIGREEVTCNAFGRCVLDRSCNHAHAVCNSNPEPCSNGEVRSVNDNCWGPCLPPTECREVTNCESCGDAVCVMNEPQILTVGCVRPPAGCNKGSYCECLGACPTSGFVCMEDDDAVHCPCPVCS